MKQFLYPTLSSRAFRDLIGLTVSGALIAGVYGILHDQVTYTLSPEYFTKFKFDQFADADPGLGNRAFAGVIGFLATWWIGAIMGWLMGRLSMKSGKDRPQVRLALRGLILIFAIAVVCGIGGFIFGAATSQDLPAYWTNWQRMNGIEDIAAFRRVGLIHNMGYIGGILGGITASVWIRRKRS